MPKAWRKHEKQKGHRRGPDSPQIRGQAEQKARAIKPPALESMTWEEIRQTFHEMQVKQLAAELEQRLASVQSDDMLTLIYTSGTTGSPKGAVYTHEGFMAGIFPSVTRFENVVRPGLVSLAILPLSHAFERMWSYGCMSMGIQIAYCPDPKEFVDVMNDIRPHFLTSVPRIWEKVYGTIQQGIKDASPGRAKLFHWAADTAVAHYRTRKSGKKPGIGLALKHALADALVCKDVSGRVIILFGSNQV